MSGLFEALAKLGPPPGRASHEEEQKLANNFVSYCRKRIHELEDKKREGGNHKKYNTMIQGLKEYISALHGSASGGGTRKNGRRKSRKSRR